MMKRPGEILPTPGERSLGQLLYETLHGQVAGMKPLCGEPYANILPESIARYEHAASAVVTAAVARREAEIVGMIMEYANIANEQYVYDDLRKLCAMIQGKPLPKSTAETVQEQIGRSMDRPDKFPSIE